jgi:PIN like domain
VTRTKIALDFCLSPRLVGVLKALYGHHNFEFLHLKDLVKGNTPDDQWAGNYARFGGHVVLSGDTNIAYRPNLAVAFIDNSFTCFFPCSTWSNLRGPQKAAAIVHWWPVISDMLPTIEKGTLWRMQCSNVKGSLRLGNQTFEQLKIPDDVLEGARKKLAS